MQIGHDSDFNLKVTFFFPTPTHTNLNESIVQGGLGMKRKGRKMQRIEFSSKEYRSEKDEYLRKLNQRSSNTAGTRIFSTISALTGSKRMESRRKMIMREISLHEKKREE